MMVAPRDATLSSDNDSCSSPLISDTDDDDDMNENNQKSIGN